MSRLIIADIKSMNINGKSVGHYFTVAQNFVDIFKEEFDVCVAGGPIYEEHFKYNLLKLNYDSIDSNSKIKNRIRVFKNMKQLFEECKNDIIVLQCSAVATAYLGIILFKNSQTKLYMIQYNILGLNSIFKRFLYRLARKNIDGIICPQKEIGKAYNKPFCVVPDYIYIGEKQELEIPYDKKSYDFGMVGIISKDKGIIEAADCLKNTSYKILISGYPQSEEIRKNLKQICKEASNIELKMEYLTEEDYKKSISQCRYCILNYSEAYSEHSSGVVFDIIFRGVPVVVSNCRSMAFIREYGMGEVIDDIRTFNLKRLLKEDKYREFIENINRYYRTHEKYKKSLKEFLICDKRMIEMQSES